MPEITIPDIDSTTFELLRQRADHNASTVEAEVKVILTEALQPTKHDPWAVTNAICEKLARSGREFSDSTPLIREDRDR